MKTLIRTVCALLMISTLFSCNKVQPEENPSYKFQYEFIGDLPVLALPGDKIALEVKLNYEPGIAEAVAQLNNQDIPNTLKTFNNEGEVTYNFVYEVKSEDAGKTLDIFIVVKGTDGKIFKTETPVYITAEKPEITVTIPESAPSVSPLAETIVFDVNIVSKIDVETVKIFKGGVEIPEMKMTEFTDSKSFVYHFEYTPVVVDGGQKVNFRIEVKDVQGNIVSEEYNVTIQKPVITDVSEFSGITMGYQSNADFGPFLSTKDGLVYKVKDSHLKCTDIDIVLFFSGNGGAGMSLTNPTTTNSEVIYGNADTTESRGGSADDVITAWTTRNVTTFKMLEDFTDETFASTNTKKAITEAYTSSTSEELQMINRLAPHMVVAFKTASGQYGMIKVVERAGNNKGVVKFDYKVTK